MSQYDVHKHGNQHNLRRELTTHLGDVDDRLNVAEPQLVDLEARVAALEAQRTEVGNGVWTFDTAASAPPDVGEVRRNGTPTGSNRLWIHKTSNEQDASALLSIVADSDTIVLSSGASEAAYRVIDRSDQTTYWEYTVAYESGPAGAIPNGANTPITVHRAPYTP